MALCLFPDFSPLVKLLLLLKSNKCKRKRKHTHICENTQHTHMVRHKTQFRFSLAIIRGEAHLLPERIQANFELTWTRKNILMVN